MGFGGGIAINNIHEENLHARIRGMFLQSFAGTLNGVVCCNSNKVEVFCGYSTFCSADDMGAIAPIADLLKVEVFEMARLYPMIPKALLPDENMDFEFAPSAELKENQKDPFWWSVDDALIDMVCNYHRADRTRLIQSFGKMDKKLLNKYTNGDSSLWEKHIDWLLGLYRKNVYKRNQYPPIVVTSKSAFGGDFKEFLGSV
jgi:NAD+ synthase (glutamine-hydrolysing)